MSPLRTTVAVCLIFAWSVGTEVAFDGWPDHSTGWWVIYISGFVVIGLFWYWLDNFLLRRKERRSEQG